MNLSQIIAAGLIVLAIVLDIYLFSHGLSDVPQHRQTTVAEAFTGSAADWLAIVLINGLLGMLAAGLMGFWQAYESPNSTAKTIGYGVAMALSFLLIFA